MSELEDDDIPNWLKWTFITINRVGFPIVAFLLMYWMYRDGQMRLTAAVEANTIVLSEVKDALVRVENNENRR
jgi:hypothetical protein